MMDTKVPVTVELISQITRFPTKGADPSQYFCGKDNNKRLRAKLKKKYDVAHDKRAYVISTSNDYAVQVIAKMLAIKMVRKNPPNQCTSGVITCVEKFSEGIQMIWSLFLLN